MAQGADYCERCSVRLDSIRVQRNTLDQAAVLHIRGDHAVEWFGTYGRNNRWQDCGFSPLSSPHARILFISVSSGSVDVQPGAIAANQPNLEPSTSIVL